MRQYKAVLVDRSKKACPQQLFLFSSRWSEKMREFAAEFMCEPLFIIASPMDITYYGQVRQVLWKCTLDFSFFFVTTDWSVTTIATTTTTSTTTTATIDICLTGLIFRSTSNNLKCLYVCLSVHKKFFRFQWNLVSVEVNGRCMTVCSMTRSKVKVTSPWKSEIRQFANAISFPIYNGGWQVTKDS